MLDSVTYTAEDNICCTAGHNSHSIIEWPSRIIKLQPPLPILDQAAQGPIQPGLEHLQGWGIHTLSGQLFQHLTTLIVKNFPLTSNLHLPSFNFNPFPLVLLLSALSKSCLPSCL